VKIFVGWKALPLLPHLMGTWAETNTAAVRPLFQTVSPRRVSAAQSSPPT